jgi:hypothetical protein
MTTTEATIEERRERMEREKVRQLTALHIAVSALHFEQEKNFERVLKDVIKCLDPAVAGMVEADLEKAQRHTMTMLFNEIGKS